MSLIVPTHHPASMLSPAEPTAIAHAVLSVKAEALKAALYMCVCMFGSEVGVEDVRLALSLHHREGNSSPCTTKG